MGSYPLRRDDSLVFLIGSNFTDYLREAYRTLKLDGQLHIIESTSRFSDLGQFRTDLETLGFTVIRIEDMWKFTHIRAMKTGTNKATLTSNFGQATNATRTDIKIED